MKTAVVEQTASERLAIARAGLERLGIERAAAGERKRAALAQLDDLGAKLASLHRSADLEGADVALAVASVTEQRTEAARQVAAASADVEDLARRMATVREELPRLEAAVMQDELAAAVADGVDVAKRYRAAVETMLEAGIELQAEIGHCQRLTDGVFSRGAEPRAKLAAHIIEGGELDRVLTVALVNNFDPAAVDLAVRRIFERWHI